jgi:hypothetical protein
VSTVSSFPKAVSVQMLRQKPDLLPCLRGCRSCERHRWHVTGGMVL